MEAITKQLANKKAQWAFNKVKKYVEDNKGSSSNLKTFRSYVKKVPTLIHNNGLGNAIAFVYSKKNKEVAWKYLYDILFQWLKDEYKILDKQDLKEDFMETIVNLDSFKYKQVYDELISVLNWLRRFAEGLIEGEEND